MLDVGLSMHILELEITTKCNLNCLHCYNRENKNIDMDYEDIIKYINFANENHVHTFTLTGGEACLHPKFNEICAYLKQNRHKLENIRKITLQTNGYIQNMDLEQLKGFDYIHLSFDVDENGARNISSKKTIELAKRLQELNIKPYLFTTVHKKNLDYIDEIVKIANKNEIPIAFNFCIDTGKDKEFLLSKEEKIFAIQKLLEYEKQGKINKLRNPYVNAYKKMCLDDEESFRIKGGCTAGIASCSILANGDVYHCVFFIYSPYKLGNIYNEDLYELWTKNINNILEETSNERISDKKCNKQEQNCKCNCSGLAYNLTGSVKACDPRCNPKENLIPSCIRTYIKMK